MTNYHVLTIESKYPTVFVLNVLRFFFHVIFCIILSIGTTVLNCNDPGPTMKIFVLRVHTLKAKVTAVAYFN